MFDPTDRVAIGDISLTRLGLGTNAIAGLRGATPPEVARATLRAAVDRGIAWFDTAPQYGYGLGERRLAPLLAADPSLIVSTKVGRLLVPREAIDPSVHDVDRQAFGGDEDYFFPGEHPDGLVFDYSAAGVEASLRGSLERMGIDAVPLVFVHDPIGRIDQVVRETWPALQRLRADGRVGALGIATSRIDVLLDCLHELRPDVLLCPGHYTLLRQDALDELFPAAQASGVPVIAAAVLNSGILGDPARNARFDYVPADAGVTARAEAIAGLARRHGVPLVAPALALAAAHPAVAAILVGARTAVQVRDLVDAATTSVPAGFWSDLVGAGLLDTRATRPA